MAVILAQKIQLTSQDGKLVRAVLRQFVQRYDKPGPEWEDAGELPIHEDGVSIALPAPGEAFKNGEND